ncbi:glycosyl hydrolase family 18 protein [Paenibacillus radicis (ex Xue et al. 2023)]|uniref:Glycosyl hydrolase family 18 protein n=1 Tax=Paenibacillus radicis (ex Xue et al. 2023) TaxID=2972489 RepID=A0ABT1YT38_9BACL|nr:glycosyl hydrolase family 18 protein [Paenibacillus radicis (ex Xue et al. 2023)]MCR8635870.1 glycosyl hydrolase family 18 protein [Paenibacillus radicis (ex Xue et al. 2023)]
MEPEYPTKLPGRKKSRKWPFLLTFTAIIFGAGAVLYFNQFIPSSEHETPTFNENSKPVFYKGAMLDKPAEGKEEGLKLPFATVQELLDPTMIYEEASESTIITTQDKVIRLRTSQLTGMLNEKPFNLKFPLEKVNGALYLPMEPLKQLYSFELRESKDTGAVILVKEGDSIEWAKTASYTDKPTKTIPMRNGPTIKSPILVDVGQQEEVMIWSEEQEWYKVQLKNGYQGYIKKDHLQQEHRKEVIPEQPTPPPFVPLKPINGKINLTWEQVVTKTPDATKFVPMPGLNVVSPTWFHLEDGQGNLKNIADPAYVKWAHSQNIQVWGLFSNGFEPKRTTEALATYDKRMKMIKQLLSFAQLYSLQGINIDFENVNVKDKEELVQFVREMVPLMHEQGLVVSIDVTPKSTNENWSLFYDRKALIESVDYMMLMAYDEHWASSPTSGSVASLPWVESSLTRMMKEDRIPASKLILSIPFYTRIWTEETVDDKVKVSSRAVFMENPQKLIKDKKLTPVFKSDVGQNYVEYKEGNKLNRIWLEDEVSIKARMDLVKKYGLAGVASWRRGYETPQIWGIIDDALK